MKKVSKNAKLITTLALLVLAFFCSFNLTYAYFTASATLPGTLNFSDVDVRFVVLDTVDGKDTYLPTNQDSYTQDSLYTISLYPTEDTIPKGTPFTFSYSNVEGASPIKQLAIQNMDNSTSVYVRFWIDAYIKDGETLKTDINYGKYITLPINDEFYTRGEGAYAGSNAGELATWCYYLINPIIEGGDEDTVNLGNTLTIDENIPDDVLGNQLQITISLQAVQEANDAYLSAFNDARGYCLEWGA